MINDAEIEIYNVRIYGMDEALIGAGYPMKTEIPDWDDLSDIDDAERSKLNLRGVKLGNSPHAHGDDKFLRQIMIGFDVVAPRYWWVEFDTYGFTVKNSQSTMHRAKNMDFKAMANSHVDKLILRKFGEIVERYKENPTEENLLAVKSNMPEGVMLGARITTNYAQLKTMYYQRKTHRLPEWREFCRWIENLPNAVNFGVCKGAR
ncbi:hypothetical protein SELR_18370 [Selenomonas ruminantium subsp. lactilytica TAM6421]|uniref:Uncharacterized protein n=1 Tax=Selenomonas ruminantium subsp. lactilytica (strain NBRC 103574 / TAM6421) TaxID=927704 RepID=I0GS08_SELRL|nr:hypothetical protein [Selenomonas ruminantium]BAL83545.1 hypothetical protein SELR_18370 [Selenomonas ruminantium subsp. lactilytica TAM6421]